MRLKDFKFYADECVEKDFIIHLRKEHHFKVKSVIEDGLKGKPDDIIVQRANKMRRFLLTRDKKDLFSNDKLAPFKDLTGIICLKFHEFDYPCIHLQRLSWHDKQTLIGKKFFVTYDDISVRYKGENGKIVNENIDVEEDCLLCKIDENSRARTQ